MYKKKKRNFLEQDIIPFDGAILIVDDEIQIINMMVHMIKSRTNMVIHTALSGEEALFLLQNHSIDILLTDLHMPGISGYNLIGFAKEFKPDLQCIVLSGDDNFDSAVEAMKLGTIDYLNKPFTSEQLIASIGVGMKRVFDYRDKQQELSLEAKKKKAILNISSFGIIGVDHEGRIIFFNSAASRIIGREHEQINGINLHSLIHHTKANGSPFPVHECPICNVQKHQKSISDLRSFCWRGDETLIHVSFSATAIIENNKSIGAVITLADLSEKEQLSKALEVKDMKLQAILNHIPSGVVWIDYETHIIVDANKAALRMIKATREEVIGRECHDYICPNRRGRCPVTDLGETIKSTECVLLESTGKSVPLLKSVSVVEIGNRIYLLESFMDLSRQKSIEKKLALSHDLFHSIINSSQDGVLIIDENGYVQFTNPAVLELFGKDRDSLLGNEFGFPVVAGDSTELEIVHPQGKTLIAEMRVAHSQWQGKPASVATLRDITVRKQLQDRVQHLANHDHLTGLPNRNLYPDRLEQILSQSKRLKLEFAVFIIDLDGFKAINDKFGHSAGDMVLKEVASRLSIGTRSSDTVGRMGGDEFLLILQDIHNKDDIIQFARGIIASINEKIDIINDVCHVGCSVGISIFPIDGDDSVALLNKADKAMYRVKNKGKNDFAFYSSPKDQF